MKLLFELTQDGSISIPILSKKLGINASVLYSRIKRLLKKKLIKKFTIDIDDSLLGISVKASVGINRDPKFKDAIHKHFMDIPEVVSIVDQNILEGQTLLLDLNAIDIDKMIENQKHLNNIPFINEEVALESIDGLKKLNKKLNTKFKSGVAVFSTYINKNKTVSVSVSKDLIEKSLSADYLAKCIAGKLGGGGGGASMVSGGTTYGGSDGGNGKFRLV